MVCSYTSDKVSSQFMTFIFIQAIESRRKWNMKRIFILTFTHSQFWKYVRNMRNRTCRNWNSIFLVFIYLMKMENKYVYIWLERENPIGNFCFSILSLSHCQVGLERSQQKRDWRLTKVILKVMCCLSLIML